MNKKIIELLDSIKIKKDEVINLTNENKLEEAKKSKEELKALQDKLNIIYDLGDDIQNNMANIVKRKEPVSKDNITEGEAFLNVMKNTALKNPINPEVLNIIKTSDENTEMFVPKDISSEIKELRRDSKCLDNFVNIELVTKLQGSRMKEKKANTEGFTEVGEGSANGEVNVPQFVMIDYKLKKYGGILKQTKEFYESSLLSIQKYFVKWLFNKSGATRNKLILNAIDTKKSSAIPIKSVDDLKDILNVKLDPSLLNGTKIITNQDGFNWLDKLKDKKGDYILQPDITKEFNYLLFGRYPIIIFTKEQISTTEEDKVPIYIGNLEEFITLYDGDRITIDMSEKAGDYWEKDLVGTKVREYIDVQVIDEDALVKGEIDLSPEAVFSLKNNDEEVQNLREEKEKLERQNKELVKEKDKIAKELAKLQNKEEGK